MSEKSPMSETPSVPPDLLTTFQIPDSPTALQTWNTLVSIMQNGPSSPAEDFIYELMKTTQQPPSARAPTFQTLTFSELDLSFGFQVLQSKTSVPRPNFWLDVYLLIKGLGIEEGVEVDRMKLVERVMEEARRKGLGWVEGRMEPGMVLFGVVETCVIQRRRRDKVDEELGDLMGGIGLGDGEKENGNGNDEMETLMEELVKDLKFW